jgi:hypothetical protein
MKPIDLIYLSLVTIVMAISYFPIRYLLLYFFQTSKPRAIGSQWIVSCLAIIVFSLGVYIVSYAIPDLEWGNRIVHAFGGGFLAYMVAFLAAKDSGLAPDRVKFFIFTFMLVMTLGIGNEVVEYLLQNVFNFTAAPHINDTWLDLISNIVGTLLAAGLFTPYLKK